MLDEDIIILCLHAESLYFSGLSGSDSIRLAKEAYDARNKIKEGCKA